MDMDYLLFLQGIRLALPEQVTNIVLIFSDGTIAVSWVLTIILYWCISKKDGLIILLSMCVSGFINGFLKITACVYRPWIKNPEIVVSENALKHATGYSFPSGHSTSAAACYGYCALMTRKKKMQVWIFVILILAAGFSRNWLGVHTPQDVIAGFATGVLSIWISFQIVNYMEKNADKDQLVCIIMVTFSAALAVYAELQDCPYDYDSAGNLLVNPYLIKTDTFKNAGLIAGLALGRLVERRFVNFSTDVSVSKKMLRVLIGSAVAGLSFVLVIFFKKIMGLHLGNYAGFCLLSFVIAGGAPLVFTRLKC